MLDREGAAGPEDVAIVGDEAVVKSEIGRLADAGVTDFVAAEFAAADERGDPHAGAAPLAAVSDAPRSPLELLEALATEDVEIAPDLHHLEIYTIQGLLTLLWHGDPQAEHVVVMGGGGDGRAARSGRRALPRPRATLRRRRHRHDPRRLPQAERPRPLRPRHGAAADLATRTGATQFVTIGHSFGGAVALQVGIVLGEHCAGVVTLSTQSAGCEDGAALGDDSPAPVPRRPRRDPAAGHQCGRPGARRSRRARDLPGAGHLLTEAGDELRDRLGTWIPERFAEADAG